MLKACFFYVPITFWLSELHRQLLLYLEMMLRLQISNKVRADCAFGRLVLHSFPLTFLSLAILVLIPFSIVKYAMIILLAVLATFPTP
jgi:hypothetical protein